jgi:hypothetical protein
LFENFYNCLKTAFNVHYRPQLRSIHIFVLFVLHHFVHWKELRLE